MDAARPQWLIEALAVPGQSHRVEVDGASIHYLAWGLERRDRPAVVLVHGFGAHAHWWDFTAPRLASYYRVVALDLGGMGDSGRRESYDQSLYAREIAAVIRDADLAPALLVGHSFGGLMSIHCCHDFPALMRAAVIVDSRVTFPPAAPSVEQADGAPRANRIYPDYAAARARFRLIPEENCALPAVLDHVARHSLQPVDGGWSWKFDPRIHDSLPAPPLTEAEMLERIDLPMGLVYGEHSRVLPADVAECTLRFMRRGHGPIEVRDAYHHVLLDQPRALNALLETLLSALWSEGE